MKSNLPTIPYDLVCSDNPVANMLSSVSVLPKLNSLNRNLISSFIRMPTVQENGFTKEKKPGCQTGGQLLWIKVTILQWFHLLVALVTHVKQSNTTTRRDNLVALDLSSVGLWREEYEFIGCVSSNKANHIQACKKRCSCSTASSSCTYLDKHTHLCQVYILWCGFSLNARSHMQKQFIKYASIQWQFQLGMDEH